jgi:hypothetical protein
MSGLPCKQGSFFRDAVFSFVPILNRVAGNCANWRKTCQSSVTSTLLKLPQPRRGEEEKRHFRDHSMKMSFANVASLHEC